MRILALSGRYVPARTSGADLHLHSMLAATVDAGHTVEVALSDTEGAPYAIDGVQVWPAHTPGRDALALVPPADLIVAQLENMTRAMMLGQWNRRPVALVLHNTFPATAKTLAGPGRVDLVAVNSASMASTLTGWSRAGWRADQPVNLVTVRPIPDLEAYKTDPGDRVTLVNVRRRDPDDRAHGEISKGGELFHHLAAALPTVSFLAVRGHYGTQQTFDDLPNVETVGPFRSDEVRDLVYARTGILVVPSSYESWGRVAVEAMASGIPIVASPTPGLVESVGSGGSFVDPARPDLWVDEVARLTSDRRAWSEASMASRLRGQALAAARPADLAGWVAAVEQLNERGPS